MLDLEDFVTFLRFKFTDGCLISQGGDFGLRETWISVVSIWASVRRSFIRRLYGLIIFSLPLKKFVCCGWKTQLFAGFDGHDESFKQY